MCRSLIGDDSAVLVSLRLPALLVGVLRTGTVSGLTRLPVADGWDECVVFIESLRQVRKVNEFELLVRG